MFGFKLLLTSNYVAVIGAVCYYAVGYSFAYGEPGNAFIGHNYFFGSNVMKTSNASQGVSYRISLFCFVCSINGASNFELHYDG